MKKKSRNKNSFQKALFLISTNIERKPNWIEVSIDPVADQYMLFEGTGFLLMDRAGIYNNKKSYKAI